MNNFILEIKFKITVICSIIGFIIGLLATDSKDMEENGASMAMGFAMMFAFIGFSIIPRIIFEFSGPSNKLYMICGPVGIAFIRLAIKVFIADGKITDIERAKLNKYMLDEFGDEILDPLADYVNENKKIKEPINSICKPIQDVKVSGRIDILYRLFSIAAANRIYNDEEEAVLKEIAKGLRIGEKRFNMIKGSILKEKGYKSKSQQERAQKNQSWNFYMMDQLLRMAYNPFVVLGINQNATNDEVKRAYRSLAKQYHPDKSMQESEETKKQDALKILEINEAYESIKKMRGIK